MIDEPFKKKSSSDTKNFFLKENTVSSLPKWYEATTRNKNSVIFGTASHDTMINKDIKTYVM